MSSWVQFPETTEILVGSFLFHIFLRVGNRKNSNSSNIRNVEKSSLQKKNNIILYPCQKCNLHVNSHVMPIKFIFNSI